MPRSQGTAVTNSFVRGLVDQATGLNFPENAVTDVDNVRFPKVGNAERRKGFDLEDSAVAAQPESTTTINEFVWEAVDDDGSNMFLVLQFDNFVSFYRAAKAAALSAGKFALALDLENFLAPGASAASIPDFHCNFSAGRGYCFITHPLCDPVVVRFNADTGVLEAARITVRVRDFESVEDELATEENPVTLSNEHHYNLKNQGWNKNVRIGSANDENSFGGNDSLSGEGNPFVVVFNPFDQV